MNFSNKNRSVWNLFTPDAKVTDDIQRSLEEVKSIRKVSYTIKSELQNFLQIKEFNLLYFTLRDFYL